MSKDCKQVQCLLSEYVDGALTSDSTWRVQMHIAVCGECATAAQNLRRTVDILQAATPVLLSEQFDSLLAAKLSVYRPQDPSASLLSRVEHGFRIARARWRDRSRLLVAAAGTTVAAAIVFFAFFSMQTAPMLRSAQSHAPSVSAQSQGAVSTADLAFVAACSIQHAQYESAQSLADPTAEIVAAHVDEAGAASTPDLPQAGDLVGSSDTE
jgi:anti-sigma factor RsiW